MKVPTTQTPVAPKQHQNMEVQLLVALDEEARSGMISHRMLFLTEDTNAARRWLAGVPPREATYTLQVRSYATFKFNDAADFDIIVVEIEPAARMDSVTFCRRLRASTQTAILVVSMLDNTEFIFALYKAGVDDYVAKPANVRLLHLKLVVWQRWVSPASIKKPQVIAWRHYRGELRLM